MIIVGSVLAIILIVILFLWFYKWRHAWNEMRMRKVPTDLSKAVGRLTEDVRDVMIRLESVEAIERPAPFRHEMPEGHRGSNASSELPASRNGGGDLRRLESISATMEG